MAATFIEITLDDLEKHFGISRKDDSTRRAFELIQHENQEAYYLCELRKTKLGTLYVKVLTSIKSGTVKARGCGKDAIRIFLLWEDKDRWTACVGKTKRINRAGATADDVVKRTIDRAREVAKSQVRLPWCRKCGRPLVERKVRGTDRVFLGCSAYAHTKCSGGY